MSVLAPRSSSSRLRHCVTGAAGPRRLLLRRFSTRSCEPLRQISKGMVPLMELACEHGKWRGSLVAGQI